MRLVFLYGSPGVGKLTVDSRRFAARPRASSQALGPLPQLE